MTPESRYEGKSRRQEEKTTEKRKRNYDVGWW